MCVIVKCKMDDLPGYEMEEVDEVPEGEEFPEPMDEDSEIDEVLNESDGYSGYVAVDTNDMESSMERKSLVESRDGESVTIEGINYILTREIKYGKFGRIYEALINPPNEYLSKVAIKITRYIILTSLNPLNPKKMPTKEMAESEKTILNAFFKEPVCHVNILCTYGSEMIDDEVNEDDEVGVSYGYLYTAMAYVEGKTLNELITQQQHYQPRRGVLYEEIINNKVLKDRILVMLKQLVEALLYIHLKDICHRDIHSENVIVVGDMSSIKLIDFGLACINVQGEDKIISCYDSPLKSVLDAPEIKGKKKLFNVDYKKNDSWQLGLLVFSMLFNKPKIEMWKMAFNNTLIDYVNTTLTSYKSRGDIFIKILMRTLEIDQRLRASMDELLEIITNELSNNGVSPNGVLNGGRARRTRRRANR